MKPTLVFVYNADSGLFNSLADMALFYIAFHFSYALEDTLPQRKYKVPGALLLAFELLVRFGIFDKRQLLTRINDLLNTFL